MLAKAFVKRGNATLIKLGDKEIDFNPDFRLYITTKLGMHTAAACCICMHQQLYQDLLHVACLQRKALLWYQVIYNCILI